MGKIILMHLKRFAIFCNLLDTLNIKESRIEIQGNENIPRCFAWLEVLNHQPLYSDCSISISSLVISFALGKELLSLCSLILPLSSEDINSDEPA